MKKRSAPGGRSEKKVAPATVAAYMAAVPKPAHRQLRQLRAAIRSGLPYGAREVISYKIPAFKTDRVLVWYAAFAKHVSLFPGAAVLARFASELREYKTSKGTVQFPLDTPLPIALIKRIVKARTDEAEDKST